MLLGFLLLHFFLLSTPLNTHGLWVVESTCTTLRSRKHITDLCATLRVALICAVLHHTVHIKDLGVVLLRWLLS